MQLDRTIRPEIFSYAIAQGWPPLAFAAIVAVESRGQAFTIINGEKLPLILFEYHVFYRNLPTGLRAQAMKAGLAARRWGEIPYAKHQTQRYKQLLHARQIHGEAAFKACSWGVGQVLGENFDRLGFPSAEALAQTACHSLCGQLELMKRYIARNRLDIDLKHENWKNFAKKYNGPGQANHYARLMQTAYRELRAEHPELHRPHIPTRGTRGSAVQWLQSYLSDCGFNLEADGIFGPKTDAALGQFRKHLEARISHSINARASAESGA